MINIDTNKQPVPVEIKKKMVKTKQKPGFTIIEIVLVLAIAGLIFAMVFRTIVTLQRAQRDTQRKNDMSRIATQMISWMRRKRRSLNDASYNNDFNEDFKNFYETYMVPEDEYTDPATGDKYVPLLWNQTRVNGEDRICDVGGQLNLPDNLGDCWPEMEIGEFQYDNNATCVSGMFDDRVVSPTGRHFAIRYRLEGGGVACISDLNH